MKADLESLQQAIKEQEMEIAQVESAIQMIKGTGGEGVSMKNQYLDKKTALALLESMKDNESSFGKKPILVSDVNDDWSGNAW